MREYKFRGKRLDNGEWVYGGLLVTQMSGMYIIGTKTKSTPHKIGGEIASVSIRDVVWQYEVDPDTAGQYTGLHDKNGVEMYEGDIYHQGDKNILYVVVWHDTSFIGKQLKSSSYAGLTYWLDRIEVIGNIYDNPDLLKTNAIL